MPNRLLVTTTLAATALLAAAAPTPALGCPPSLSIERPKPAESADTSGAFVVVHANRGCHPGQLAVTGTAEGMVAGSRRSITLDLARTDTPGVYVVRRQWPREGVWVLRLTVTEGDGHATALVGIGPSGEIATIREPARHGEIRDVSDADVAALLRSLAAG